MMAEERSKYVFPSEWKGPVLPSFVEAFILIDDVGPGKEYDAACLMAQNKILEKYPDATNAKAVDTENAENVPLTLSQKHPFTRFVYERVNASDFLQEAA